MSGPNKTTRITACMIDGSTICATAVEQTTAGARVVASELVELPRVAESVDRHHHPIFMDISALSYKDAEGIAGIFGAIFEDERFRNPVVGIMPPDVVAEFHLTGAAKDRDERRKMLLKRIQWTNPYRYPSFFMLHEEPHGDGRSTTHLMEIRMDDFVQCAGQFEKLGTGFLGLVTGQAAAAALFPHIPEASRAKPVTIIDTGKNRTLYSTLVPNGRSLHNAIPVGLARDDVHVFNAIPPSIELIMEMQDRIGGMFLLPPEATPTPLFTTRKSTPQIDCTRFAVQIARFANRTLEGVPESLGWPGEHDGLVYLLGRGSRLPGLAAYLYSWTEADLHAFETAIPQGIELDEGLSWPKITDSPSTLGAALAWFTRAKGAYGLLLRDQRIRRLGSGILRVAELEDETLYVSERAFALIE